MADKSIETVREEASILGADDAAKVGRFWLTCHLQEIINDAAYFRDNHEAYVMWTAFDFDHEQRSQYKAADLQAPSFSYTEELARVMKVKYSPKVA